MELVIIFLMEITFIGFGLAFQLMPLCGNTLKIKIWKKLN